MDIDIIPNKHRVALGSVTVSFRAICDIVEERFEGRAVVTYAPVEHMPEYVSVERLAESLREAKTTHEGVAAVFRDAFNRLECRVRVDVYVKSAAHPDAWVAMGDMRLPRGAP